MIPKSITPTELRANLYGVVREVASQGHCYLITPSEGDGVVMCSREDYNALVAERQLLRDLRTAEADVAAGRTHTTGSVRTFLVRERQHAHADSEQHEHASKNQHSGKRAGTSVGKRPSTKRRSV